MSDDSETMEDKVRSPPAEVADGSCTLEFIEIVPLDTGFDDFQTPEFICPVVVLPPEELQEIKQEFANEDDIPDLCYYMKQEVPANENESEGSCFAVQVSS